MKIRIKTNGIIMFLSFLLIAIFPTLFIRKYSAGLMEEATEALGIVFILSGQVLRVSARGYKSEHSHSGHTLIRGGPYLLVRNPMYLGILLIGTGVVLMLFKWWAACVFLIVFVIRYILLIFKEEKNLEDLFSETYADYCRRVPRLLPSVATMLKMNIREYLPLKLSWFKREMGPILVILFLTLFLESWEDIRNGGLGEYLKEAIVITFILILFIILVIYLSKKTATFKDGASGKSENSL